MQRHRRDLGFSLAALIFFATAASIFIASIVPAYQMQAKRELEEELIFRGGEYTRAVQKYQRRFGVYPSSIDQLVSTNTLRFVRRAYKDPITGKDFRLITIGPDGTVSGSKLFTQNMNNQPLFGNTQTFGQGQTAGQGQGQNNQQQRGQEPGGLQQQLQMGQQLQQAGQQLGQAQNNRVGGGVSQNQPNPFGGQQGQQVQQGQRAGTNPQQFFQSGRGQNIN